MQIKCFFKGYIIKDHKMKINEKIYKFFYSIENQNILYKITQEKK